MTSTFRVLTNFRGTSNLRSVPELKKTPKVAMAGLQVGGRGFCRSLSMPQAEVEHCRHISPRVGSQEEHLVYQLFNSGHATEGDIL